MSNHKTMQFEFHEIMRASRSFDNRNRSVFIASALMFMLHSIVYVVWIKNSVCQPVLFQLVLSDTSWLFYTFFAKDELRRAETKSINHGADIKWRANEIPTYDEDKPTPCFISRDKKESHDSSIIPDWCPPDEQCVP